MLEKINRFIGCSDKRFMRFDYDIYDDTDDKKITVKFYRVRFFTKKEDLLITDDIFNECVNFLMEISTYHGKDFELTKEPIIGKVEITTLVDIKETVYADIPTRVYKDRRYNRELPICIKFLKSIFGHIPKSIYIYKKESK